MTMPAMTHWAILPAFSDRATQVRPSISGMVESVPTRLGDLSSIHISSLLDVQGQPIGSLMGVFIPQKLADTKNQGFLSHPENQFTNNCWIQML